MKKEFQKLGLIHNNASSLHEDKKRRKSKSNVEVLDSSDTDNPFTLSKPKAKGRSIHEIIVKHEHTDTPSSLSTNQTSGSIKENNELRAINDRIEVINQVLETYTLEDPEYADFLLQKRTLLLRKLKVLPTFETTDGFMSPTNK